MRDVAIPAGFEPVDVGAGFLVTLGGLFIDRGRHRLGIQVGADQCNSVGSLHGGTIATLADAQIIAINARSEARTEHHPTISLSIDYLAPARIGDWLEADVTLDRKTRTLFFTRAQMRVGDTLIARATAIYRNTQTAGG